MTPNNNYLYTSITSAATDPTVYSAVEFYLQPRNISIITVQAPTELKPQYIY